MLLLNARHAGQRNHRLFRIRVNIGQKAVINSRSSSSIVDLSQQNPRRSKFYLAVFPLAGFGAQAQIKRMYFVRLDFRVSANFSAMPRREFLLFAKIRRHPPGQMSDEMPSFSCSSILHGRAFAHDLLFSRRHGCSRPATTRMMPDESSNSHNNTRNHWSS